MADPTEVQADFRGWWIAPTTTEAIRCAATDNTFQTSNTYAACCEEDGTCHIPTKCNENTLFFENRDGDECSSGSSCVTVSVLPRPGPLTDEPTSNIICGSNWWAHTIYRTLPETSSATVTSADSSAAADGGESDGDPPSKSLLIGLAAGLPVGAILISAIALVILRRRWKPSKSTAARASPTSRAEAAQPLMDDSLRERRSHELGVISTAIRSKHSYKWAWICPLEVEHIAAVEMLDEHHTMPFLQQSSDHNVYALGSINGHNIVIASLHSPGNSLAATVVAQMRATFPNLAGGVLVGIGGGVPTTTDRGMIRLGHVVASKPTGDHSGAVQYDSGRAMDSRFVRTGALAAPSRLLLNAAHKLEVKRTREPVDPVWLSLKRINTENPRLQHFGKPSAAKDQLYPPAYRHRWPGKSCDEAGCDAGQRIPRPIEEDSDTFVTVHRGTIASGGLVIKDAKLRDKLARQHGVLCFEMEAAGVLSDFPCMVIRGISDYCDSHKNDEWHGYAAAAAAAYARELFYHTPHQMGS